MKLWNCEAYSFVHAQINEYKNELFHGSGN